MKFKSIHVPLFLVALVALTMSSAASFAQATPDSVSVLLTESVLEAEGAAPDVKYWWSRPDAPTFSETDELLRSQMLARGVEWTRDAKTKISRVYLRPNLPNENAAVLGDLLGAGKVYTGTIEYERFDGALSSVGWRARVNAQLVDARTQRAVGKPILLERTIVSRRAGDDVLARVREQVATDLARLLVRHLANSRGPVGFERYPERLIVLRRAGQGAAVERALDELVKLPEVEEAHVRWATQGFIAIEINPGKDDPDSIVEVAARSLAQARVDEQTGYARVEDPELPGVEMLDVVEKIEPVDSELPE